MESFRSQLTIFWKVSTIKPSSFHQLDVLIFLVQFDLKTFGPTFQKLISITFVRVVY
jgi:hypothetical protein